MITVIGPVKFRPDGTGIVQAAFAQWQNGKQELVWPEGVRDGAAGVSRRRRSPSAERRRSVGRRRAPSRGGAGVEELRRRARRRRCQLHARGGRAGRRHGAERLGQDHALQPDRRGAATGCRPDPVRAATRSAGSRPHRVCGRGSLAPSSSSARSPACTALENVLVGRLYGRDRHGRRRPQRPRPNVSSRWSGWSGRGDVPAAQLTLIDRKRLELARALATGPELLLLDEFMAGLNPDRDRRRPWRSSGRCSAAGVTVLMVEHIVWALMDLCGRLVVLSAGEKIAEGAPAAVAADPAVHRRVPGRRA